jgi:hypothetical protein
VSASAKGKGELITKPLTFSGTALVVNITSKGDTRFELQDPAGKALPGFAMAECQPVKGDHIAAGVQWTGGDLKSLAGKPVRLRVEMNQTNLYSLQFAAE